MCMRLTTLRTRVTRTIPIAVHSPLFIYSLSFIPLFAPFDLDATHYKARCGQRINVKNLLYIYYVHIFRYIEVFVDIVATIPKPFLGPRFFFLSFFFALLLVSEANNISGYI